MKTLFWVLAILVLAVALTTAAHFNTGYVLLVLPPYRAEFSLNFMVALWLVMLFFAYGLIRLGISTFNLPAEVRAFKLRRQQEKTRVALEQAMLAFSSGQYQRSEQLLASVLEQGTETELVLLLAARSAHALHAHERRDAYLARAGKSCADYPETGMLNDPP